MTENLQNGVSAGRDGDSLALGFVGAGVFVMGALFPVALGVHPWMAVMRWIGLVLFALGGGAAARSRIGFCSRCFWAQRSASTGRISPSI